MRGDCDSDGPFDRPQLLGPRLVCGGSNGHGLRGRGTVAFGYDGRRLVCGGQWAHSNNVGEKAAVIS